MKDVIIFMDFFIRYESIRIVVYEGDNDLVDDESSIEKDFLDPSRKFIRKWHETLPETEIYFLSIKPSPTRAHATERYREANGRLARLCEANARLHFIDVFTPMLDAKGEIRPELYVADGIHLNARGYALWTRIMRGHLSPGEVVPVD
jgi:lysophospholipase L1-like esterase